MLFLETERTPATRITGYFENVVPNLSDSTFQKNFRMRRNTFTWLTEYLAECRELIPGNIGSGGRAAVPLADPGTSWKSNFFQVDIFLQIITLTFNL